MKRTSLLAGILGFGALAPLQAFAARIELTLGAAPVRTMHIPFRARGPMSLTRHSHRLC